MEVRPKDKDLKGWLKRKGGRMHTWSRRWFVLTDKFLFTFLKEDDKKNQDCIALDKQIVVEPPVDLNDPRRCYFDIVTESDKATAETLSLCAETEDEKIVWVRALKRALYADKGGALFGQCQSLEEILFWEKTQGRQIPYITDECVEYLYKYGLDVEGIFRLPGRQSVIKDVITRFDRGEKIKFEDEGTDVHVVASVLKTFLRELPDSVIPCKYFQKFMNIALRFMEGKDAKEKEACVEELVESMKVIPKDNYRILKYVCKFLQAVGLHESKNKMTMMSLGTVFGYNLIRHIDKENSQLYLCTADLGQNLVYMLLTYYAKVFVLEYSDSGELEHNVPTADLLRMSRILPIPPVFPTRAAPPPPSASHLADLEGLDFNYRSGTPSSKGSDSSLKITDDHYSPVEPSKKALEDSINMEDLVFVSSGEYVSDKKRSLHLSLKDPHDMRRSFSSPSSPNSISGNPPVPPRRTRSKSKISRNRNLSERNERRRQDGTLDPAGSRSPRTPVTPEGVNSDDVLKALASVKIRPSDSTSSSPVSLNSHSSISVENNHDVSDSSQVVPPSAETVSPLQADGKVGPSTDDLRLQVTALKEELAHQRDHYKQQVAALKSQLTNIREKYEHRINTMQAESQSQRQELEKKLENEKQTSAAALASIVKLKEELNRYQMTYGELGS